MFTFIKKVVLMVVVTGLVAVLFSCSNQKTAEPTNKIFHIAVFVPGVVQGSPSYEMLVAGVKAAVDQAVAAKQAADFKVVEGGFNQGDWQKGVLALASSGEYDLIVSSNPSMPDIAAQVAKEVPAQHFLILDGLLEGNTQIKTITFNQYEQAYLNGYYAALISNSNLPKANRQNNLGLLAGQEYPVMNKEILAGFTDGAKAVSPDFKIGRAHV